MNLTPTDIASLRTAIAACRVAGIEGVVIDAGMVRGLTPSAAICTALPLSIDPSVKLGLARLPELERRLSLFGTAEPSVEVEVTPAGDARRLTARAGGTRLDYRCSNAVVIRHPKSNSDQAALTFQVTADALGTLARACKAMGAEQVTLQVARDGTVRAECRDSNTDAFQMDLADGVEFEDSPAGAVHSYDATSSGAVLPILLAASRDAERVSIVMTRTGCLRVPVSGLELIVLPRIQLSNN
jgi:hypothetical protein